MAHGLETTCKRRGRDGTRTEAPANSTSHHNAVPSPRPFCEARALHWLPVTGQGGATWGDVRRLSRLGERSETIEFGHWGCAQHHKALAASTKAPNVVVKPPEHWAGRGRRRAGGSVQQEPPQVALPLNGQMLGQYLRDLGNRLG